MKIGITERGDAGLDFNWYEPVFQDKVNGAILITKNINEDFIYKVIKLHHLNKKLIVHCTCTGFGGTFLEPNVPNYKHQLNMLFVLIHKGFPKQNCVLRIDPIFPTESGLKQIDNIISYACFLGLLPDLRIRISILDEYKHVKERFIKRNWEPIYGNNFGPSKEQLNMINQSLSKYSALTYECCNESGLASLSNQYSVVGCVSMKDIAIMGLNVPNEPISVGAQRKGCTCLSVKTELLNNKHRCPHMCEYCYWKD